MRDQALAWRERMNDPRQRKNAEQALELAGAYRDMARGMGEFSPEQVIIRWNLAQQSAVLAARCQATPQDVRWMKEGAL